MSAWETEGLPQRKGVHHGERLARAACPCKAQCPQPVTGFLSNCPCAPPWLTAGGSLLYHSSAGFRATLAVVGMLVLHVTMTELHCLVLAPCLLLHLLLSMTSFFSLFARPSAG